MQVVGPIEGAPVIAMDALPMLISNPSATEAYRCANRTCSGVPSLAISPGGRLWAAWYSGTTPGTKIETCPNAYVVVSTSGDGGKTWKEVLAIDPDASGPLKSMDPRPWIDPQGRLWIIWHITINGVRFTHQFKKAWAISADDSESENPTWTSPRHIADGVMLNKPIVLSSGDWLFTAHDRKTIDVDLATVGKKHRRELTAFISQDDGRSWSKGLVIDERVGCTYPDAQQRPDGTIYVSWDFNRSKDQEILLTTFREEDALNVTAETMARVVANRRLVSKGGTH